MTTSIRVLSLFAHPDDAEFLCAGTLALLADQGAQVRIATMTAGDCGSTTMPAAKIAVLRQREAAQAAKLIGARYKCLGEKDLSIFYDRRTLGKVMELIRSERPDLVLTHSPSDYMVDHETTSRLCQTACFGAMAPNYRTGFRRAAQALSAVPHLYYADAFGRKDILGNALPSAIYVDIARTLSRKEKMLGCHKSQEEWLKSQQKISQLRAIMLNMVEQTGQSAGLRWAEGFRQHLGQGFPQDNLLGRLLGNLVGG